MNYPESVHFLYALGNEIKTAKLGLDRIGLLLGRLGNPHRDRRFIHVAGTNGKGSVCAMIESALRAAGVHTGLFTSPHLVEPVERIRVGGLPVDAGRFSRAFDVVHAAAESLLGEGRLDCHPTYFETVTAMALVVFRDLAVSTAVLEVGLGGRLDATNVVSPVVSVITPIDFDHEAFLGKSLESIALEKGGILKPGIPAVLARQRPEVEALLERRAAEVGAPLVPVRDWRAEQIEVSPRGSRFLAVGPRRLNIECPLAGEHQVDNALTALAVLDVLGISVTAIESGLRQVRWPGRLECVSERPDVILDGAHNPAGARSLADYIRRFYGGRRVWLIYGTMRDKAVTEIAGILFPLAERLILAAPDHPRAVRPEALLELADHPRAETASSLRHALEIISAAAPDDAVFVSGSLFLVGEARALLVQ